MAVAAPWRLPHRGDLHYTAAEVVTGRHRPVHADLIQPGQQVAWLAMLEPNLITSTAAQCGLGQQRPGSTDTGSRRAR